MLAFGLAPGTFVRSETTPADTRQLLHLNPLAVPQLQLGRLRFVAAWGLSSPNPHFGGYSALLPLGDSELLAASDRSRMLRLGDPDSARPSAWFDFFGGRDGGEKWRSDIEALARDSARGRIWVAYEGSNRIDRMEADFSGVRSVAPQAMRGWPVNGGPEAMVRLSDGRFVVMAEASSGWLERTLPGVLFPADPVEGALPVQFRFAPPDGYAPTDAAQLPDGRVLILLRAVEWDLPPGFSAKLAVADPRQIKADAVWPAEVVADLSAPMPTDNFEGLAVAPGEDGAATVWLISDDNGARFQLTLLLIFRWKPTQKARRSPRAPLDGP